MIILVKENISRFCETLTKFQRQQLPYAAVLAVNQTARLARQSLTRELPGIFSGKGPPTRFTRIAMDMTPARAASRSKGTASTAAVVFVKPIQAGYLGIEETGGTRDRAPGKPILTPVDAKLNVYGNIPKDKLAFWRSHPERYFIGAIRGVYGAWERIKAGKRAKVAHLKLLVAFRDHARYHPKFGFQEHVAASVKVNFMPALSAALARAMKNAIWR